jgi:glycerol-3-phosphate O-acyltransferase
LAQRLSLLGGFSAAEITDRSVFAMLVGNLLDTELLREDGAGMLQFGADLVEPLAYAELVLPAEVQQAVRRMAAMPSPLPD